MLPPFLYILLTQNASTGYAVISLHDNGCTTVKAYQGFPPFNPILRDVFVTDIHAPLIHRLLSVCISSCYYLFSSAYFHIQKGKSKYFLCHTYILQNRKGFVNLFFSPLFHGKYRPCCITVSTHCFSVSMPWDGSPPARSSIP